jgi:hypothetical protein
MENDLYCVDDLLAQAEEDRVYSQCLLERHYYEIPFEERFPSHS